MALNISAWSIRNPLPSIVFSIILLVLGALAVALFFVLDLGRFLTLASLKANRQALLDFYSAHRLLTVAGFMTIYIVQTALSLPGAAILSLAAGAVFGSIMGTIRGVRVLLEAGAKVEGDVHHQTLSVDEGAQLEGRIRRATDPAELRPDLSDGSVAS